MNESTPVGTPLKEFYFNTPAPDAWVFLYRATAGH
jgi:hypothetical protein